jgi:hypothetical protein
MDRVGGSWGRGRGREAAINGRKGKRRYGIYSVSPIGGGGRLKKIREDTLWKKG